MRNRNDRTSIADHETEASKVASARTRPLSAFQSQKGMTILSIIVAAGLIIAAIGGIGASSVHMKRAMRSNELANLAVSIESSLINEFNNKTNYPEPGAGAGESPNDDLRKGILTSLTLNPEFGTINVPIQTTGTQAGVQGFLDWNLNPCPVSAFDGTNCVLRYEVRLKRMLACGPPTCPTGKEIYSYAFSYQIDADPEVVPMAPLGNATTFDTPIDPGNYRVETTLAKCDPGNDLFMIGINRDTGEAYCVKKPLVQKCPEGRIPKGLKYSDYSNPTIELDCTSSEMRTFNCDPNYSLQYADPKYADPETGDFGNKVPGKCVFTTKHTATMPGAYPPSPTPYMRTVSGTMCPPFYSADAAGSSGCHLAPNTTRNNDGGPTGGKGRCATKAHKGCTRTTQTRTWYSNMVAWNAWNTDCIAKTAMVPPVTCPTAPSMGWWNYTCGPTIETSTYCSGSPDISSGCSEKLDWSPGTAYATGFYDILPSATPIGNPSGRMYSCTFQDTSAQCPHDIPELDFHGNNWGKKSAKWYGGVQIIGVKCTYDQNLNMGRPEMIDAH